MKGHPLTSRVDGGFSGSHRHVRCVGNERGTLHDRLLLAIDVDGQLGEIHQHLSHLVSAFTTATPNSQHQHCASRYLDSYAPHVDDDVRVGELGQRLTNDSLAASESTGNAHGTTLDTGEKSIEHTLSDDKGAIGRKLFGTGTRHTDGPWVHHAVLSLRAVELKLENLLVYGVLALVCDAGDGTLSARGQQDLVVAEQAVLDNATEHITTSDVVSDLVLAGGEVPLLRTVESRDVDSAGDVNAVGRVGDTLERALDTVIDGLHETGAELNGERLARPDDWIADRHTGYIMISLEDILESIDCTSLFVNLDSGLVGLDSNDLTDEVIVTNANLHVISV